MWVADGDEKEDASGKEGAMTAFMLSVPLAMRLTFLLSTTGGESTFVPLLPLVLLSCSYFLLSHHISMT